VISLSYFKLDYYRLRRLRNGSDLPFTGRFEPFVASRRRLIDFDRWIVAVRKSGCWIVLGSYSADIDHWPPGAARNPAISA
jgi:hypothetical protein